MANEKNDLVKKIRELHPSKGRLRDDGGSTSVGIIFPDKEGKAIAYSLGFGNWNPYGGTRNSGITKWQGISVYDGQTEIEVKPMAMWRDGENQYNDNPANHYIIREFKEIEDGKYELFLENFADRTERHSIDFKEKKSKQI